MVLLYKWYILVGQLFFYKHFMNVVLESFILSQGAIVIFMLNNFFLLVPNWFWENSNIVSTIFILNLRGCLLCVPRNFLED